MTLSILFAATPDHWAQYAPLLRHALKAAGIDATLAMDLPPEQVDYIVYAPNSDVQDFTPFTRLRAVLNLWAGVETVVGNTTLRVPLCRMVDDDGLTQGMREWVTGHVLRHHLGLDAHIVNPDHLWAPHQQPLAGARRVTMLGLGELGTVCGRTLADLGFDVTGWSRRRRDIPGLRCLSGPDGLDKAISGAEIVVLLLPDTPATHNILDAQALARLARGAVVINPGRGPLIDDAALLEALDSGHIAHATLDVFRTEPLPKDHPYWAHPNVTVTPHIAAETRADSAAHVIADNIRRDQSGQPLRHVVDRTAGY
ncbi:MAG: 2-hydroxyacid dehydrogenase [Paracoccaceae bacterium]